MLTANHEYVELVAAERTVFDISFHQPGYPGNTTQLGVMLETIAATSNSVANEDKSYLYLLQMQTMMVSQLHLSYYN